MKSLSARVAATAGDPAYRFGMRLGEVHRLWRAELDSRLRPLGLSTARWVALANLSAHPEGLTQNQLAIIVGIKGSTLVRQRSSASAKRLVTGHRRIQSICSACGRLAYSNAARTVRRSLRHRRHLRHKLPDGFALAIAPRGNPIVKRMIFLGGRRQSLTAGASPK